MLTHLQIGKLTGSEPSSKNAIERDVMLVYAGSFESMEGPVDVHEDNLRGIAGSYNGMLKKLSRLVKGDIPVKELPPVQLDHSSSAAHTVGRMTSKPLEVREVTLDGKKTHALFGRVRILGSENVEKVEDGRWKTVSGGFDFEKNEITELSITPFPAAKRASLLRGKEMDMMKRLMAFLKSSAGLDDKKAEKRLSKMSDDEKKNLAKYADDHEEKMAGIKCAADDEKKDDDKKESKMAEGESEEDKENKKKLAEKEKEDKAKLSNAANAPDSVSQDPGNSRGVGESKLAADEDEEDSHLSNAEGAPDSASTSPTNSAGAGQSKPKLVAAPKENVKRFSEAKSTFHFTQSKMRIGAKLTRLRAAGKITPAELKKIDVVKLARSNKATQEAVLSSYESREPVIMVGLYGSSQAEATESIKKQVRMTALESETRANFKSLPGTKKEDGAYSLSEDHSDVVLHGDTDQDLTKICHLIDGGKKSEAKVYLRKLMSEVQLGSYKGLDIGLVSDEDNQALVDSVNMMENEFNKLQNSFES